MLIFVGEKKYARINEAGPRRGVGLGQPPMGVRSPNHLNIGKFDPATGRANCDGNVDTRIDWCPPRGLGRREARSEKAGD